MIVIVMILISFVISSSNPSNGWSDRVVREAKEIVRVINNQRGSVDKDLRTTINFDYLTQSWLEEYAEKFNLEQNSSTYSFENYTRYDLGFFLMKLPHFDWFKRYGFKYLTRHNKNNDLKKIMKNQRECIDFDLCSKTEFHNLKTCIKNIHSNACNNAHLQYLRFFSPSLSRIAYVDSKNYRYYYGRQVNEFEKGVDFLFYLR